MNYAFYWSCRRCHFGRNVIGGGKVEEKDFFLEGGGGVNAG